MSASYTSTCRDTSELNEVVQFLLKKALIAAKKKGVNPLIVETYRSQKRQNYLYCQGRSVSQCVAKGISASFAKANCKPSANQVTWTLTSLHKSRKAIDIIPQRKINGKMTAIWNANDEDTKKLVKCMVAYGFEAGANWKKSKDSPHFQINWSGKTTFKQGCTTIEMTKLIQTLLNKKMKGVAGYTPLKVNGIWGTAMDNAVKKYRKHIKANKIDATVTLALLKKLIA